jgi:hypothetical protein
VSKSRPIVLEPPSCKDPCWSKDFTPCNAFVRGSTLVQQLRVAVPFLFSYLAMPVRQMVSGVVVDGSSPAETWLAAATRAVARDSSAVGDEPGLLSYVLPYVLPYLLTHVPERVVVREGKEVVTEWCPGRHFRGCQGEKHSRIDCACCRARIMWRFQGHNWDSINATPVCLVCCSGWTLTMVSRNWHCEARLYARAWKRCYCGRCDESWFRRGWICEGALQIEAALANRTQAVRELSELTDYLDDMDDVIDYLFSVSRTRRERYTIGV